MTLRIQLRVGKHRYRYRLSHNGKYLMVNNATIPLKKLNRSEYEFYRIMNATCKRNIDRKMENNLCAVFFVDRLIYTCLLEQYSISNITLKPFKLTVNGTRFDLPVFTSQYNQKLMNKILSRIV